MHELKFVNVLLLKLKSMCLSCIFIHKSLLLRIIFRSKKFTELLVRILYMHTYIHTYTRGLCPLLTNLHSQGLLTFQVMLVNSDLFSENIKHIIVCFIFMRDKRKVRSANIHLYYSLNI